MNRIQQFSLSRSVQGSTLIELMVAIIIGMVMVIAAFTVLANFEGNKRTTTAMNDAMQSANFGIYELDKLIRSAGTGLAQFGASGGYGCPLNYLPGDGSAAVAGGAVTLPAPFAGMLGATTVKLAPAVIFPNAPSAGTDSLMLMLGGAGFGEAPVPITEVNGGKSMVVDSAVGLSIGEWVLLGQAATSNCMITHIDPTYAAGPDNVVVPVTDAGVGAATTVGYVNGYMMALGTTQAANFMVYGVNVADDSLYSVDILNTPATSQKVTDDIMTMRAVYGVSAAPGGNLTWVTPTVTAGVGDYTPATLLSGTAAANTALRTIRAIRVAMVIRAPLAEKANANGTNAQTGNAFNLGSYKLFSSLNNAAVVYTWNVPADQTNYRYQEIEATVPIRNGIF